MIGIGVRVLRCGASVVVIASTIASRRPAMLSLIPTGLLVAGAGFAMEAAS